MNRRDQSIEKNQLNSNLADHGRVDMPAGPLVRQTGNRAASQPQHGSTVVKETIRPQRLKNDTVRSAVVKPKPKVLGDGSLRYDEPASPAPKLRQVAKLDRYVKFLSEQEHGEVVNELTEESLRIREKVLAEAAAKFEAALTSDQDDPTARKSETKTEPKRQLHESAPNQSHYRFSPLTTNSSAMRDFYVHGISDQPTSSHNAHEKRQALPPDQAEQIWAEFEQAQRHPVAGVNRSQTPKVAPTVKRNPKPIVVFPADVSQQRRERTLIDIVVPGLSEAQKAGNQEAGKNGGSSIAQNKPSVPSVDSDEIPQKAFFVRKTTDGQTLTLPEVKQRYDHAHEGGVTAPRAHVKFTQESQIQNQRQYQEAMAREKASRQDPVKVRVDEGANAKADLGAPNHPFSSVTYDDATANVIATISAAIASVIRDESEQQLKEQADQLLRFVHQQASVESELEASGGQEEHPVVDEAEVGDPEEIAINEDMLNDIVRQRFENYADMDAVNRLLHERIDSHKSTTGQNTIRVDSAGPDDIPTHTGPLVSSISAFAAAQPSLSSAPAVVTESIFHDQKLETGADEIEQVRGEASFSGEESAQTEDVQSIVEAIDSARKKSLRAHQISNSVESASQSVEVIDEIPLELAAWDVEDFRWPVVSNQMIVTGGPAIEGLLSATLEQLPNRPRRIAVSGVGRVHGTTSLAISVSRWAAAAGHRTLLIDADVASPSLSGKLGVASNMSWLNGINHELPVSELVIRSRKTNLCVMPLASSVTRVTWPRFIFDNLGEVLEPIRNRFDLIVIDAGPASQLLDELSSPSRLLDAVMLVNDVTESKKLETFKTRLKTFGVERFIVADNRVPEASTNVA